MYNVDVIGIESLHLLTSLPHNMDMESPTVSSIKLVFSQSSIHRGSGHGFIETGQARISLASCSTSCVNSICTISFSGTLPENEWIFVSMDRDFLVGNYNLPVEGTTKILFRTAARTCDVTTIQSGLGNTGLCSCTSVDHSCLCTCGDVSINRGL